MNVPMHRWQRLLAAESRLHWSLVLVLAIVVTGVEVLGAVLVFLLIGLVAAPDMPVSMPVVGDLEEVLTIPSDELAAWLAASIAIFFLLRGLLVMLQIYVQDRLAHNAGARLAIRLLSGYLAMPYLLHLQRDSSELIRNTFETVRALTTEVLLPAVRLVSNLVLAIGMAAVLVYTAPLATVAAGILLLPIMWLLLRVVQPRLRRLGQQRQRLSAENLRVLQQSLHGIREVTLFGRTEFFRRRFASRQEATARISYLSRVAQEIPRILIETTLVLFIAGFFVLSVTIQRSPQETLAILGLFAYVALRLQPSLHKIVQSLNSIRFASAAVDDVVADLAVFEDGTRDTERAGSTVSTLPEIRLDHVSFDYSRNGRPVLHDIDLRIAPREAIGIVGPTGGGKSTLIDVITGLLPPTEGRVLVDGADVRSCTAAWHTRLGVVPQTTFLLDDSLRRNIALGVPDEQIDEACIAEAVSLAQLSEFVDELPDGLDTTIGERGVRLSGGQQQRTAIARALYRRPSVLVFDEGTSALDGITEAELIAALDRAAAERTVILVAHRLTTVRRCDRIFVVDGGRIVDEGTYDQLQERNLDFRRALFGTG